ncbi:MAG TPA: DMT family transporter [Chitinophagaceae bacterium]|nr:DMT family transporter [Chitinophagaceae bacterium]
MRNDRFVSWGIFILLCIIWGSSFILMKASKDELTWAQIASLRIFSAGIVMLPFAIFYFLKIPFKKMPLVILSAICGNLFPAYLFAGAIANNIDSSLAGILNSLTPICVVVTGFVFFKSKIETRKIIGVLIGFTGLTLLTLVGNKGISFENVEYTVWILLATILYGFNINIVSHYLRDINPVHLAFVSIAAMIIPTGIVLWQQNFLQLPFDDDLTLLAVINSVLLGVAGTAIATALFYVLVKKAGGLFASLVTYGIPFVALAWGFVFGETITLLQIGCLMIILCGVYLANLVDKKTISNQKFQFQNKPGTEA